MKYDFTSIPDRSNCGSQKWNAVKDASVENVPLSVADMEFYTAPPIKEAIKKLADTAILGYTNATDEYYEAVCGWMKRRHGFDVKKEWIINTPGVVDALAVLVDAVTKPCDSVIILTPVYYPFDMSVIAKGRRIIYSTLINNNGHYEIDYSDLREKAAMPKAKALLFCNPHNPVGRVWTKEELSKVADICCDNDVFIIDDEIHHDLIMPGYEHTVMATVSERVKNNIAVCTAPSKTFNIAGLGLSNIFIPNLDIKKAVEQEISRASIEASNVIALDACKAAYAYGENWLDELLEYLDGNVALVRSFLKENLPQVRLMEPDGTYLIWLDFSALGLDSDALDDFLIQKAKVWLNKGTMFGDGGECCFRMNLGSPRHVVLKALEQIKEAVDTLLIK
mgnify:CR=1 FL=1